MTLPLPRRTLYLAAGALALVAASLAGSCAHSHHQTALAVAQADAASARRAAADAAQRAQRASAHVAALQARADSLAAADSVRQARVNALQVDLAVARSRYDAAKRAVAPDTVCYGVVASADTALAAGDTLRSSLTARLQGAQERVSTLQTALDTATATIGLLRGSQARLVSADDAVSARARPSFLARIAPHAGLGVAAGIAPDGRPTTLFGVTFGWSF